MADTDDMDLIRVGVLGVSVDQSTTWTTSGPQAGRNALDASIVERIITRVLNDFNRKIVSTAGGTDILAERFNAVIGDEAGVDQAEFDALGGNLIQTLAAGGLGGGRYVHEQTTAADSWTITHSLGFAYVAAQVVRDTGVLMWPDITYLTNDSCRLDFAQAVMGTAILRR